MLTHSGSMSKKDSKYDNILSSVLSEEPKWSIEDEQVDSKPVSFFLKKTKSKFQVLLEPFKYITSNPGKEIRGKLIEAFNIWLNVPPERLQVIAKIVNMLHAASLMYSLLPPSSTFFQLQTRFLTLIKDRWYWGRFSTEKRETRWAQVIFLASSFCCNLLSCDLVAHKIYGIPQTINTANYVYFLAYKELFSLRTDSPPTTPPQDLDALVTGNGFLLCVSYTKEI